MWKEQQEKFRTQKAKDMSRKSEIVIVVVAVVAILLGVAVSTNLYYLRDDSGGQLLWNGKEAYLFMEDARRGFRFRVLDYPWIAFKEWVNAPALPTREYVSLTVIHITALGGVDRHIGKGGRDTGELPSLFTPVGESIFANRQGTLCKWTGDHFEKATKQEEQAVEGVNRLVPDIDTSINGWSKRGVGVVAGDSQFSVSVGQEVILLIKQGNVYRPTTSGAGVELHRTGQSPQELWRLDGRPRRVSRAEYEKGLSAVRWK